jgi:pimeloyl-ACP methyl ester carboxylesterase
MAAGKVDVNGHRLGVRLSLAAPTASKEEPPAVVFVHGIGMSHRSFARIQRLVSRSLRTLAIDLPGFGGAASPHRRLGIRGNATVVAAALQRLGVGRCTVVGQSMGTQIAVELAHLRPELVQSIVLIGPVVDDRRPTLAQQAAALLHDSLHEGLGMNAVVATDYLRSIPQFLRELQPMLRYPTLRRVAELAVPVLVVRGTRDPIARRDWAQRVIHAAERGALVEAAGPHHVQQHAPEDVAAAIVGFIRTHAQSEPR